MKFLKFLPAASLLFVLAGCGNDAEKFEGYWQGPMGLMLFIEKDASAMQACIPGVGMMAEKVATEVKGDALRIVGGGDADAAVWRKVDGKPQLVSAGQVYNPVGKDVWTQDCEN